MSGTNKRHDIMSEFVDMFDDELVSSILDLEIPITKDMKVTGLCKLSRSVDDKEKMNYLSLVFLVDKPTVKSQSKVKRLLGRLTSEKIQRALPEVRSVMLQPSLELADEVLVRQVDLEMKPGFTVEKEFVEDKLSWALSSIIECRVGHAMWWEDIDGTESLKNSGSVKTLVKRIKGLFS